MSSVSSVRGKWNSFIVFIDEGKYGMLKLSCYANLVEKGSVEFHAKKEMEMRLNLK